MAFSEIRAEDFQSFTPGKIATHIQIEQTLNEIGGGGQNGVSFKRDIMKAAGWPYDGLTGYAKKAQLAAEAFNKVRKALDQTQDKQQLLELLQSQNSEPSLD